MTTDELQAVAQVTPFAQVPPARVWRLQSLGLIVAAWAVLQLGGLFSPGLLDDVDSVYLQIAREMLGRHDYVTPTIDGIRFFDKPPLMYWMAAGSMRVFGVHDWAARLPLAVGVLALLVSVYALGIRLYQRVSPEVRSDRGGLYAALAVATAIGPYLYTRFYIPDILIALWMTLSIHLFLVAMDRVVEGRSALWPSVGFGAVMALDVLTKGLIGIAFPVGFVLLYLAISRRLTLLRKLHLLGASTVFLLIAAPWHVLAALRNPAIAMPAAVGLPPRAGWAWFYLYNEHIARFLGRRIPHDYGQTPVWLFWLYALIWILPWGAFLPGAIAQIRRSLKDVAREREATLTVTLWALIVLLFFTFSSRQEYYSLPALPALALMAGGLLARADATGPRLDVASRRWASVCHLWVLSPVAVVVAAVSGYFAWTAPKPPQGATLDAVLSSNPAMYNVSLGHMFDLTTQALGFFRGPMIAVAIGMIVLGPAAYLFRHTGRRFGANLLMAAAMVGVLLAAHEGLVRFYPILGSKDLTEAIKADGTGAPVLIDGELTSGSSLLFYLDNPVLLVNGRVNGPWFGSFWPNARPVFLSDAELLQQWHTRNGLYLLTYHPEQRIPELCKVGPVTRLAASGGKTVLRNGSSEADICGVVKNRF
jgi:4-amino-4-deoxy-L-arabinose transferase-like glycosyltransferase